MNTIIVSSLHEARCGAALLRVDVGSVEPLARVGSVHAGRHKDRVEEQLCYQGLPQFAVQDEVLDLLAE